MADASQGRIGTVDEWLSPMKNMSAQRPPIEVVWALILYLKVINVAIMAATPAPTKNIGNQRGISHKYKAVKK